MKIGKAEIVAGLIASLGLANGAQAEPSWAKKGDNLEKCAGIAKKKSNDCGANGHSCANKAEKDSDPNEWVYLPEGVCEKIVGGKVLAKKTVK
ncbi:MAG: DUF2282 domain-containing protein [Zetaproteobacteria bacterium]|nr:DUF2282 domain-containing protein [Zetaproteobacteria bacterium]